MLNAAAAAIAWLAQKGVVYTDLRGPNVVVDASGDPWLVGFDDCLAIDESVGTLAAYEKHLAASPGAQREATFAARLGVSRRERRPRGRVHVGGGGQ